MAELKQNTTLRLARRTDIALFNLTASRAVSRLTRQICQSSRDNLTVGVAIVALHVDGSVTTGVAGELVDRALLDQALQGVICL